jgi:anti-sigma factor RsiW
MTAAEVGLLSMTKEEARGLFDAALDGELSAEKKSELDMALAKDTDLQREFLALRAVVQGAAELQHATPSVDLLSSVQLKLRARSGGRFYRDRFSEQQSRGVLLPWALGASLLLVVLVVAWLGHEAGLFSP